MTKTVALCLIGVMVWSSAFSDQGRRSSHAPAVATRIVEWTIESKKIYSDPFDDVDVDVIFRKDRQIWRVPAFWRGDSRWTVRFAPPAPGEYTYELVSTDRQNPDLNGHAGRVTILPYTGTNSLLRHGMLRVSRDRRHFEHTDGTPFYWLGDTWWSGLSTRLSWDGFQKLTSDRRAKGFSIVQVVAGLVPPEEQAPSDPGCCNEGGCVWDQKFNRINPKFFDYADRRIQYLVNAEIAPAIVGAWAEKLGEMGVVKLEKHWRYIIARYSAYPVFWIVGGEVFDPPEDVAQKYLADGKGSDFDMAHLGGWTAVARYIRASDPLHHPVTAHENPEADDLPLQDESLTDFQFFQPSHFGWSSIDVEISQLNTHYARRMVTKPLVVGEIGYENLGGAHLEDFQRVAFWLAMLNGAAGYSYGANGTWESYTSDKPFHRLKWSLMTWVEGMNLPGSYQIGLGAKLLQQYAWWRLEPHPEWVTPRGTTLFDPRDGINEFHVDVSEASAEAEGMGFGLRESEWQRRHGDFRLPYTVGIENEVRIVYMPYFGLVARTPPTVLGLEPDILYHAYFWEPSLGVKFDLGMVERPKLGDVIRRDHFDDASNADWDDYGKETTRKNGALLAIGSALVVLHGLDETNLFATVHVSSGSDAGLVLRFHDINNYIAANYAASDKVIYVIERKNGVDSKPLGRASVSNMGPEVTLSAEVSGGWAAVSIKDGEHSHTSQIVRVDNVTSGAAGLLHAENGAQTFENFELRRGQPPHRSEPLQRQLTDARGDHRGYVGGSGSTTLASLGISSWDNFGRESPVLLGAYRPERLPYGRDWILVLERVKGHDLDRSTD